MGVFRCPYCKNSYVEEELEEDSMGFEYVEKTLKCKFECEDSENCNFESLNNEDINAVCKES